MVIERAPVASSRVRADDVGRWLGLTRAPDAATRCRAVRALCPCHVRATNVQIWRRIFEMARDPSTDVRRNVFHALGDGSPRELESDVIATLEIMREDPDLRLRKRARKLLDHYRRTGTVNIL